MRHSVEGASGRSEKRADTGDRGVTREADHSDVDSEDPLRIQRGSRNCDARGFVVMRQKRSG